MNAVIYARQSSGSDDYSESVENQIANCLALAKKNGLTVVGCFSDLNTSGKTYPEGAENIAANDSAFQRWFDQQTSSRKFRPGLGQVFQLLGTVDYVIVDEMTRLYRPVTRSFLESYVNQRLTENGVKILQCKGGKLDLTQFDQQLIQSLKNQIQDEAIANQKKKSQEQFRKLRDSGYQCNGAKMFGIRYLGNRRLEVIPECAEVIRFIYDNIAAYRPYSAIIRDVNRLYSHCFRTYCYESTFRSIARQPIYCGYQYNSEHELIPNRQIRGQEIIPYQLWLQVGEILDRKRKSRPARPKKHWLPMSGHLICGRCGGRMTCQLDRGKLYYICNKTNLHRTEGCSASRVRFQADSVGPGLYEVSYPFLLFGLLERFRLNAQAAADKRQILKLKKMEKKMNEKERQMAELFLDGTLTREQLEPLLTRHREKRHALQSRIRMDDNVSAKELKHERKWVLPDLFKRIRSRELDHGVYEDLFSRSIIKIALHKDVAEFNLVNGWKILIPRLRYKRRSWFPHWNIAAEHDFPAEEMFSERHSPLEIVFQTGRSGQLYQDEHFIFRTE